MKGYRTIRSYVQDVDHLAGFRIGRKDRNLKFGKVRLDHPHHRMECLCSFITIRATFAKAS